MSRSSDPAPAVPVVPRDERRARRLRTAITVTAVGAVLLATVALEGRDDQEVVGAPSPAPTDAEPVTDEEFCRAYEQLNLAFGELVASPSRRTTRELKAAVTAVSGLVAGADMDERAKEGARFITSSILDLGDVADAEDIAAFDAAASIDDTANAKALGEHVKQVC